MTEDELIDLCSGIRTEHRQRVFGMEQRKRAHLALASYLRLCLGWRLDAPLAERNAISKQALDLVAYGETQWNHQQGKRLKIVPASPDRWDEFAMTILAAVRSRAPFMEIEASATKEMSSMAEMLPVWEWAKNIRGLGSTQLAIIVGEATTDHAPHLGLYRSKGGLWKRLGIATVDGIRQGGLPSSAAAGEWVRHGYSAMRRARIWVIGDVLIKNNRDGPYRSLYLERKDIERQRAEAAGLIVAPSASIPAKRRSEFISDMQIHRRAQRVMEQRLIADLWRAWRAERRSVQPLAVAA